MKDNTAKFSSCAVCGEKGAFSCQSCASVICRRHAIPVGYNDWLCVKCAKK